MPIIKGDEGATLVQLGLGDVAICIGSHNNSPTKELVFVQDEPHGIGEWTEKHKDRLSESSDVRVQFSRVESVDVVIEQLQSLKAQMREPRQSQVATLGSGPDA